MSLELGDQALRSPVALFFYHLRLEFAREGGREEPLWERAWAVTESERCPITRDYETG